MQATEILPQLLCIEDSEIEYPFHFNREKYSCLYQKEKAHFFNILMQDTSHPFKSNIIHHKPNSVIGFDIFACIMCETAYPQRKFRHIWKRHLSTTFLRVIDAAASSAYSLTTSFVYREGITRPNRPCRVRNMIIIEWVSNPLIQRKTSHIIPGI